MIREISQKPLCVTVSKQPYLDTSTIDTGCVYTHICMYMYIRTCIPHNTLRACIIIACAIFHLVENGEPSHTHPHTCTHTFTHAHTLTHSHTHTRTYTYTHIYTCTCTHSFTHTHTHTLMRTHQTSTHTQHTNTHTHTLTHTPTLTNCQQCYIHVCMSVYSLAYIRIYM